MTNTQRFQVSKETADLIKHLRTVEIGNTATYADLSTIAYGDVQKRCRANLDSARRILQHEEQMLFGTITGVGLKRLSDLEVSQEGKAGIKKVRRVIKRTVKRLACVSDFDNLPNEAKVDHNSSLSILGAIDLFSKKDSINKISNQVKTANDRLAIGQTLELFQ
jgi:hypothetical protein